MFNIRNLVSRISQVFSSSNNSFFIFRVYGAFLSLLIRQKMEIAVKRLQIKAEHYHRQALSILMTELFLLKQRVFFALLVWQPSRPQTIFSLTMKQNIWNQEQITFVQSAKLD